jgi:hypothetical protein
MEQKIRPASNISHYMLLVAMLALVACGEPTDTPFAESDTACEPGIVCIDSAEPSVPTGEGIGINLDLREFYPTTRGEVTDTALEQVKPSLNFDWLATDSVNVCELYDRHTETTIVTTVEGQNTMLTDGWRDSSRWLHNKRSIWMSNISAGWMNFIDFEGEIIHDAHIDVSTYVKLPDPTTDESVWYCSVNGSTARVSDEHIELRSRNLRRMGGCSDAVAIEGSIRIPSGSRSRFNSDARRVVFRNLDEEVLGISDFAYPTAGVSRSNYDQTQHIAVDFGTWGGQNGAVVMESPTDGDYTAYVKMPGSDIVLCVGAIGSEDGDIVLTQLAQLPSCETSIEIDGELEMCTGR